MIERQLADLERERTRDFNPAWANCPVTEIENEYVEARTSAGELHLVRPPEAVGRIRRAECEGQLRRQSRDVPGVRREAARDVDQRSGVRRR